MRNTIDWNQMQYINSLIAAALTLFATGVSYVLLLRNLLLTYSAYVSPWVYSEPQYCNDMQYVAANDYNDNRRWNRDYLKLQWVLRWFGKGSSITVNNLRKFYPGNKMEIYCIDRHDTTSKVVIDFTCKKLIREDTCIDIAFDMVDLSYTGELAAFPSDDSDDEDDTRRASPYDDSLVTSIDRVESTGTFHGGQVST